MESLRFRMQLDHLLYRSISWKLKKPGGAKPAGLTWLGSDGGHKTLK